MKKPELMIVALMILTLTVALLIAPAMAADPNPTTELHIVKYADDGQTILNETTVDYHWMEANLPVQGDGVTRYYMEGPVFEGVWEDVHPDEAYDAWDPNEDVQMAFLYKGDFGAVRGTKITDLCDYIGGASPGDTIKVFAADGWARSYPYSQIYAPDPRQGPPVLCWYSGNGSGPDAQEPQGQGYPDTGYTVGMRMIFFADNSTNPWGWHAFGNNDMRECWNETYWNKGGQYWSVVGTSGKWVDEVRIYSHEPAEPPAANFTVNVTSGEAPLAVAFTDTSTGNPSAWSWDFGDGDTSDEQHPVHVYTEAGTYTVTLTVTNAVGSDTETDLIAVADGGTGFVRGPYLTGTTTNLTVVSWKSDENCTGTVEFADDAFYTANSAYDRSVDAATTTDFQHVTIENLAPDTLYHYRIAAGDATTADHTFRTFPEHGGFTFIVYGDTQLPANIELVADRITDEHPLFVLHTGDLVNDIESEDELDNFFESSRQMLANTTLYTTLGNHEYYTTTSPSPTTGNSIYHNITGMPEWYSFNCSNAHFAILDDNNDYADITQESAWLEQDLSTDAIWKFVANHHPPYSSVSGRAGGWLYPRQWWGQTMQDAGVSAVFNGHVHAYERYIVDGITYLVTGTGAGSLCSLGGDIPDGYQTSLTHTLGYTKITVYPNGTAAGQFVEVARLDPDNSSKVLEVYPPGTVFETYTITSPLQGADLAAVSLDIPAGVTAGTACTVNGTVDNLGDAISAPFSVTLSIGASLVDTAAVDPLAPNETTVVSFSWTPSAPGATNVTMAIDPAMTVQDTDRTNNNLTVAVTVADSGSGSDTAPVAGFTANVTSGEAPLAVAFTDTSSGAPSAWSWTFGDGATSNEQHPVHIYTAAGTYTVGLTAANAAGSNSTVQSGYIVVTSIEPANETITLYPGWNFVSTPKTLADGHDTIAIFGNVDTAAHSVLLYNGLRGWKAMSSQDTFRPLDGIWIYANGSYAIPLVFAPGSPQTPPEKTLDPGWNAIGFTGTVPETAADALRSVEDRWVTLIGFDAEQQVYGVSIIRGAGGRHDETREMSPMQGYWLYMNDVGTLDAIDA